MSKRRVYEIAKEIDVESKNLIKKLEKIGIVVKNHMSTLTEEEYKQFMEFIDPNKEVPEKKLNKKTHQKKNDQKKKAKTIKKKPVPRVKARGAKKNITPDQDEEVLKPKTYKKKTKGTHSQYKRKRDENEVSLEGSVIEIEDSTPLTELAQILKMEPTQLIKELMMMGEMISMNSNVSFDTAALLAMEKGIEVKRKKASTEVQEEKYDFEDEEKDLIPRSPVVTVMGHVDHGKTSLLDAIRNTNVTKREAGGITQHIGASEIEYNEKKIVFLDTPGHEAFTSLRARGAQVTDIAILVVAADDGVQPQTIEAIHHAKDAGVPLIVAINKMDVPGANPQRVKQELSQENVLVEDWGGETISVEVSAKNNEGIDNLLEMVLLVAEMLELKANPNRAGVGTIIEANVDKRMGTVATVLLEKGTIKRGDSIFAGSAYGRVRTMKNDKGKMLKEAGPSSAFEISGLNDLPTAGDKLFVVEDDQTARANAEKNALRLRQERMRSTKKVATLENMFDDIQSGSIRELNIILRADVHGSIEAITSSLEKLSTDEVRVNIIKAQVGAITTADILLANTSGAIIFAFNVRPNKNIVADAERENVEIRTYRIIYNIINDVRDALQGLLDPEEKEVVEGNIVVRETFKVPGVGTIAGGYVQDGKISRNSMVRLVRDDVVIYEGEVSSLKRFKDDAREVQQGFECGIGLKNYNDIKEGDVIETFYIEKIKRELK